MVNLTRIYTRTGDAGSTRLSDGSLTDKTDARVEAYGAVDEANSVLGLVLVAGGLPDELAAGEVTIKDLDAGRARAAAIADNEAWKAERPGQQKVARGDLVATVRAIIE